MAKERRSLYDKVFGKNPKGQGSQRETLRMLNGFSPVFTAFSGEAYDSDVVRATVDAIARNAAKLKPKHIRRQDGKIMPTDSKLEKVLQVQPNPYMNAYSFYYKVVTQLYMQNNAYIFVDWDPITGNLRGLYPVTAPTILLQEDASGIYAKFYFMGGQQITLPYSELIHIRRFFYQHDIFGESSDTALTPTLDLIQTTDEGIKNAVKSSAFLRGLLKFTTMLKDSDMKKQRDAFIKDYMDITNNGGIAATDSKADYVELKNDPKMIDEKQMGAIKTKVHDYFGINGKIVDSSYNENEWNAFYESVIEPIAIQLGLEFTNKLFTDREKGFGNEIIFEANRLQYASNATKLLVVETLMDRGLLSKDEGREIFNLGPIEGGDERIMSLNFVNASVANQYQLGKQAPPASAADPPAADEPKQNEGGGDDGAQT